MYKYMLPKLKIYRPIKENRISQGFGLENTASHMLEDYRKMGMRGHNGVDMVVDHKPLYWNCNVRGLVYKISTDSKGGLGLDIISYSREGYYKHRYWHLERTFVKEGDVVESGQMIAITGNTGWSTGPHLHYGFKPQLKDNDGKYHNTLQNNGYYGAVSMKQFYTNIFILSFMKTLIETVLSLAKRIFRLKRS